MCHSQFTVETNEPGGERAELVLALPKAEKDTPAAMCKAIADFDTVGALRKSGIYHLALTSTWEPQTGQTHHLAQDSSGNEKSRLPAAEGARHVKLISPKQMARLSSGSLE